MSYKCKGKDNDGNCETLGGDIAGHIFPFLSFSFLFEGGGELRGRAFGGVELGERVLGG